jgi:hypothetical protein
MNRESAKKITATKANGAKMVWILNEKTNRWEFEKSSQYFEKGPMFWAGIDKMIAAGVCVEMEG